MTTKATEPTTDNSAPSARASRRSASSPEPLAATAPIETPALVLPMAEPEPATEARPESSKRRMPEHLRRFLLRLQGGKMYLPSAYRVVWFRDECPDWGIETALIEGGQEAGFATVRAVVTNSEGRVIATAHKTETKQDFPAGWVEKAECVPLDTRILTLEGWKTFEQLRLGELVAAYDGETDSLKWTPLEAVRVYENAPLRRLSNRKGFDVLCTPDHKWVVSRRAERVRRPCRRLKSVDEIHREERLIVSARMDSSDLMVCASQADAVHELPVLPDQAFVMGMLITDGCLRYTGKHIRGYICQAKPEAVSAIRACLADIPHREEVISAGTRTFPSGRTCDTLAGYRWHFPAGFLHDLHDAFGIVQDTDLPGVIGRLSPEARTAFLEAMMLAEGDGRGNFTQMPGRNDFVIDIWTILCALEGHMVCRAVIREDAGGIWRARRKCTRYVYMSSLTVEEAGRRTVWCPQTRYGTWVARFANDVVTITGNSGAVARALALCGFGTQFMPELDDDVGYRPHPAGLSAERREEQNLRPAGTAPQTDGAPASATVSASPIWEGPGQCPRCHAPEGKRHGKPCVG